MPQDYEERKQARIDRYRELAEKNARESERLYNEAHKMAEVIPFGQPILVGHYSEKSDRNYRNRIHNKFGKSFEASDKAKYYETRAASAESNRAISSDDPNAPDKLRERIAELEQQQVQMKAINKAHAAYLKNPRTLEDSDLPEKQKAIIRTYKPAYSWEPHPIAPYEFQNLGGNIRRLKQRLQSLETQSTDETTETQIGAVRISDNVEENRLQIFFPGKPSEECRSELKHAGFRWSPYNSCWQRQRSNMATYYASEITKKYYGGEPQQNEELEVCDPDNCP